MEIVVFVTTLHLPVLRDTAEVSEIYATADYFCDLSQM